MCCQCLSGGALVFVKDSFGFCATRWHLALLRSESETHASVYWFGDTWNFRSAFDKAGIKGDYFYNTDGQGGGGLRQYGRIYESFDVTEGGQKFLNMFKDCGLLC